MELRRTTGAEDIGMVGLRLIVGKIDERPVSEALPKTLSLLVQPERCRCQGPTWHDGSYASSALCVRG